MTKKSLGNAFLAGALMVLTACTDPSGLTHNSTFGAPLTTQEIRNQLAGSSLVGVSQSGNQTRIYLDNSLTANYIGGGSSRFELLQNGILCNIEPNARFCYRSYISGDDVKITYADGTIRFQGKITKGNIFSS